MYSRILVGTDGSATAERAVERAVALAVASEASLTIFSAGRAGKAEGIVASAAAQHASAGVAIDTKVVDDDPVDALISEASSGSYDLLVIGNKGMTGLGRFLRPGSVPNKVTHHIPCSLLIVKTT